MKKLGTILPTLKHLECNRKYAENKAKMKKDIAIEKLSHCTAKFIQGEWRYFETPIIYAVIKDNGKIIWFEIRDDGDYPICKL